MDSSTLPAHPTALRLGKSIQHPSSLTLVVRSNRPQADLPWHGGSVRLELRTRRFRCRNSLCTKRVFCERLPRVVAHYGRKSARVEEALRLIGYLLGREACTRATRKLAIATSPDTLLRLVRSAAWPCSP